MNTLLDTVATGAWRQPPQVVSLALGEVHVWRANLGASALKLNSFEALLSDEEQQTAARFFFEADRKRYAASHGLLRLLLAGYAGTDPAELGFSRGPWGKPALCGRSGGDLQFNLSHSGDVVLFAYARGRQIGVDVERVRPVAIGDLAASVFSAREVNELNTLAATDQEAAFFRCWTLKEAFIKATGRGLSQGLDRFDVSLLPGARTPLLATHDDPLEAGRWSLMELAPGDGYAGALAVQGAGWRLETFEIGDSEL